jgi:hypothetical protein
MNSLSAMNGVNTRHMLCSLRGRAPSTHFPFLCNLMEGAHFALVTRCTPTMYRPRITELSDYCPRGDTLEPRSCISGTGTCITHVKLEHEATGSKRGGNDNCCVPPIFHSDRQMQEKVTPQAKNEVMDGHGQRN